LYFGPKEAEKTFEELKKKADECQLKSARCVVCVFGQTWVSDYEGFSYRPEGKQLSPKINVYLSIKKEQKPFSPEYQQ
jgi:hypothetical protein